MGISVGLLVVGGALVLLVLGVIVAAVLLITQGRNRD